MKKFRSNIANEAIDESNALPENQNTGTGEDGQPTDNSGAPIPPGSNPDATPPAGNPEGEGGEGTGAGENGEQVDPNAAGTGEGDGSGEGTGTGEGNGEGEAGKEPVTNVSENGEQLDADVEAATAEVQAVEDSVEASRVEGEQVEEELVAVDGLTEELEEIAQESILALDAAFALESISDTLTAQIRAGSLNRESTTYMMGNANAAMRSINQPKLSSYGLESADEPDEKVGAATTLKNTITGFVTSIKTAVIEGLKKAATVVAARFKQIFDASTRLKARADGLLKAITAKDVKFRALNSPKLARELLVDGTFPKNVSQELEKAFRIVSAFNSASAYTEFKTMLDASTAGKSPDELNAILGKLSARWAKLIDAKTTGTEQLMSPSTLGGKIYTVTVPSSVETIDKIGASITNDRGQEAGGEIRSIEAAEAKAIVSKVISTLDAIAKHGEDPALKEMERLAGSSLNKIKDDVEDPGNLKRAMNALLRLVTASTKLPSSVFTAAYIRQASAALDWVQASVDSKTMMDTIKAKVTPGSDNKAPA